MSQKNTVFAIITGFLVEKERVFEEGVTKVELSTDDRKAVVTMLVAATEAGEVEVKKTSKRAWADITKYWDGTVSNWLRKDERLNGGVKHKIAKPGSRAGSKDKPLMNLRRFLIQVEANGPRYEEGMDVDAKAAVNAEFDKGVEDIKEAIVEREEMLAAEKLKDIAIDSNHIPESLHHLLDDAS